jgi:hypothetical protein
MEWILRSRLGANLLLIAASAALPAASVHFLMTEGNAPISGKGTSSSWPSARRWPPCRALP